MTRAPVYTIGYDGRELRGLIALLCRYDVAYLIDVRARPTGDGRSDFDTAPLTSALQEGGIRYVAMGDMLGEGADGAAQERGLARLQNASGQGHIVALLSAERDPARNHRAAIGRRLAALGVPVLHIGADGQLLPQNVLPAKPVSSGGPAAKQSAATRPASARPTTAAPTLDDARRVLKQVFGYDDFLPMQPEVISSILERRDTLAVMPTGGGKSVCYQAPALLFPGLTVVISPLISLMQDQVDQLRDVGVPSAFLNSNLSWPEQQRVMSNLRARRLKLLYIAPESLIDREGVVREDRLEALESARVDCLTIDEAHCISQWGHDFRPEYNLLREIRRRLPGAVTVAVTATATKRVREDIRHSLGMDDPREFIASFNRPNLNMTARQRTDGVDQLAAFLRQRRGQSGIIYCLTIRTVEETAEALQARGFNALHYHGKLDKETRLANQRAFIGDEAPIIVATTAFGMGINKPNVRFVVHYNLPHSVENYYQEIGRAGRDGQPADCLLLYNDSDLRTIRFLHQNDAKEQKAAAEERLQAMLRFVRTHKCRRVSLLAYFGERYDGAPCGACDKCVTTATATRPKPAAVREMTNETRPAAARVERAPYSTPYDPALFEYLLIVRKELAAKAGLPSYSLFSSKSLMAMAAIFPHSIDRLLRVEGVDPAMAERFGAPLLEAIRTYCARHGIRERR